LNLIILSTLLVFPALMVFSALSDLFTMTIPNRVSLALAIGYFALAFAAGVPAGVIGVNALCGLGILVLAFGLFSMGWIGGGDAKLAAATSLWLGWALLLDYGVMTSIIGGALTLTILFARKASLPAWAARHEWVKRLHSAENGVPYGIALAVAGLMLYPQTQLWQVVSGH
jgi:prepilin peptidase CpaA